ncbi:MAG: DinB family protein, partial [Bacteroidota bacterium]
PSANSAGFLIRHIADVEKLFSKNVFGKADVKVVAKTVIDKKDTGEHTDLSFLLSYQNESSEDLASAIALQSDSDWSQTIETKEFGVKTKAEALGRITSHTAYHAGQLALILKYGK